MSQIKSSSMCPSIESSKREKPLGLIKLGFILLKDQLKYGLHQKIKMRILLFTFLSFFLFISCEDPSVSKKPWETPLVQDKTKEFKPPPVEAMSQWDFIINYFSNREEALFNYYYFEKRLETKMSDGRTLLLVVRAVPKVATNSLTNDSSLQGSLSTGSPSTTPLLPSQDQGSWERFYEINILENTSSSDVLPVLQLQEKGRWSFGELDNGVVPLQLYGNHLEDGGKKMESTDLRWVLSNKKEKINDFILSNLDSQNPLNYNLVRKEIKFSPFDKSFGIKINCYNAVNDYGSKIRSLKKISSDKKEQITSCLTLYDQYTKELLKISETIKKGKECSEKIESYKNSEEYKNCEYFISNSTQPNSTQTSK